MIFFIYVAHEIRTCADDDVLTPFSSRKMTPSQRVNIFAAPRISTSLSIARPSKVRACLTLETGQNFHMRAV